MKMRKAITHIFLIAIIAGCGKASSDGVPEIRFKKITEQFRTDITVSSPAYVAPTLTIQLRDANGDFGFEDGKDTSYIYIRNISVLPGRIDSFKFPEILRKLPKGTLKNFVDVDISLNGNRSPGNGLAYTRSTAPASGLVIDSSFYEVYVKDFKKKKSNVIITDKPLVVIRP
jgi:hypothetical protein